MFLAFWSTFLLEVTESCSDNFDCFYTENSNNWIEDCQQVNASQSVQCLCLWLDLIIGVGAAGGVQGLMITLHYGQMLLYVWLKKKIGRSSSNKLKWKLITAFVVRPGKVDSLFLITARSLWNYTALTFIISFLLWYTPFNSSQVLKQVTSQKLIMNNDRPPTCKLSKWLMRKESTLPGLTSLLLFEILVLSVNTASIYSDIFPAKGIIQTQTLLRVLFLMISLFITSLITAVFLGKVKQTFFSMLRTHKLILRKVFPRIHWLMTMKKLYEWIA